MEGDEDEGKAITGFIQDIQIDPLSISMWSEEDVDYFHSVGNDTTIIIDATCGVADKIIKKRIHYFALILNMMKKIKTEPSHVIDEVSSRIDGAPTIDGFMKSYMTRKTSHLFFECFTILNVFTLEL